MHTDTDSPVTFTSLGLSEPILRALAEKNYSHPSPIQAQAIPYLMEGRDLVGCAQTGTGKTAAFALPMLHRFSTVPKARVSRRPRALILTPTRELAAQIAENIGIYGKHLRLRHALVFGGVGQNPQVQALAAGVDILVATPGRLLDLLSQGAAALDQVEMFVLDEADRMLDMGFAPDVKRIIGKLPQQRQSLLFSATMPEEIRAIAARLLHDPVRIEVTPVSSTVERIDQRVLHVHNADKHRLLVHLLGKQPEGLVLVFSRTKHGANKLATRLERDGIRANAIHGNKSQGARTRALDEFRTGETRVLVATDIAARGIDVKGIAMVVNYDLPNEPEAYVHRIGRTARAGADGLAFSFCSPDEREYLRDIQRLIRKTIPVHQDHPFATGGGAASASPTSQSSSPRPQQRQTQHSQSRAPRGDHRQDRNSGGSSAHAPRSATPRDRAAAGQSAAHGSRPRRDRGEDRAHGSESNRPQATRPGATVAQPAAPSRLTRFFSRFGTRR